MTVPFIFTLENMEIKIVTASKLKAFRILGVVTLLLGLMFIFLYFANSNVRQHGGKDLSVLLWFGLLTIAISLCVILLMRWAIVLVASCYMLIGGWLILGSMLYVPLPECLTNICVGLFLLAPMFLLIRKEKRIK